MYIQCAQGPCMLILLVATKVRSSLMASLRYVSACFVNISVKKAFYTKRHNLLPKVNFKSLKQSGSYSKTLQTWALVGYITFLTFFSSTLFVNSSLASLKSVFHDWNSHQSSEITQGWFFCVSFEAKLQSMFSTVFPTIKHCAMMLDANSAMLLSTQ